MIFITALQSGSIINKTVDAAAIYASTASVRPEDVIKLIRYSLEGNFLQARKQLYKLVIDKGISADDLISQIYKNVIDMDMPDKLKLYIIDKLGETDFRISEGADERIQMEAFIATILLKSTKIKR